MAHTAKLKQQLQSQSRSEGFIQEGFVVALHPTPGVLSPVYFDLFLHSFFTIEVPQPEVFFPGETDFFPEGGPARRCRRDGGDHLQPSAGGQDRRPRRPRPVFLIPRVSVQPPGLGPFPLRSSRKKKEIRLIQTRGDKLLGLCGRPKPHPQEMREVCFVCCF